MHETTERSLAYTRRVLVFSKAERETLRRAMRIAELAREYASSVVGAAEWDYDEQDMELAHVEHGCRFLLEDGPLVLSERFDLNLEGMRLVMPDA